MIPIQLRQDFLLLSLVFDIGLDKRFKSRSEILGGNRLLLVLANEMMHKVLENLFTSDFFQLVEELETFFVLDRGFCLVWGETIHFLVKFSQATFSTKVVQGCLQVE